MTRNILLHLQFIGSNYAGWQKQKNGLAVQQVLEEAIERVTGEKINLIGCSRTDSGVHAERYIANFRTESSIPISRLDLAVGSQLPNDIFVKRAESVRDDFNSRRDSLEKKYRYQIYLGKSPFCRGRWWLLSKKVEYARLSPLARLIMGDNDFAGFCVRKSLKKSNRCLIKQATWRREGKKLYFTITGNRFLHRMVRFLVGAQIEVATGKMSETEFIDILRQPRNCRAKFPAPAEGLYLAQVKYRKLEE